MARIGLIAGSGQFPVLFAQEARRKGDDVIALALSGITSAEVEKLAAESHTFKLGQLEKPIQIFKKAGVKQAVMAGKVQHRSLFGDLRPDLRAVKMLARLKDKRTDTILGEVAKEFAKDGIELISSATYLSHLIPAPGVLTRTKPDAAQRRDIALGWTVAKSLSGLDVGQTVVVGGGAVVAVEAMEGTDACILRAGAVAGLASPPAAAGLRGLLKSAAAKLLAERGGLAVVKVAKPKQDFRFDLPVIGLTTLEVMKQAGASVLAVEAGRSLLFDREEFLRRADRDRVAVVAMEP
ncbi:MAG: UDP-2,3-diacylglucosamine diphosphatase LpxI [Elusimicrobia bacterium]|nr:UDP-2,3-diacylglucosamine diphosphatase LpxI [Elusimicrobiota bacterium]